MIDCGEGKVLGYDILPTEDSMEKTKISLLKLSLKLSLQLSMVNMPGMALSLPLITWSYLAHLSEYSSLVPSIPGSSVLCTTPTLLLK